MITIPQARRVAGAAALILALTSLTACANPVEQLTQGAIEGLIEQQTGGNIDLDIGGMSITTEDGSTVDFGGSAGLPNDWPGLPVPNGEVIASVVSDGTYSLTIHTSESEMQGLISSLQAEGFEITDTMNIGELNTTMLESTNYRVSVAWFADEDAGQLQYVVITRS